MLVGTTYECGNGRGKKAKTNKQTFWCIRADVVRKLDRGEPEPETARRRIKHFPQPRLCFAAHLPTRDL